MAGWLHRSWEPSLESGLPRRDLRSGEYAVYTPDKLTERPLLINPKLSVKVSQAERSVGDLSRGPGAEALEGISRFLLRSEAIASSMIEGISPSPQQVAIAELAQAEPVYGFSDQAKLVANNITILRAAAKDLVAVDLLAVGDVVRLHSALLPEERHHGLRRVQNWIGGSNWHPLEAAFVPPPAEAVQELMADLVAYLNGSAHAPLVQAALLHAQFETIHPFTDGNGRVGRALIHTVLTRRGLTPAAILPVSLVFATLRNSYIDGLTAYRYEGDGSSVAARKGIDAWLGVFLDAALIAAEQARQLAVDISGLRKQWAEQVASHRVALGLRDTPRADSATARLLALLPEIPIVTTRSAQSMLGISFPAARAALDELAEARVLHRKNVERNTTGYLAMDVFSLLGQAERRLASTQFDTRVALPNRPVPARPQVS